MPKKPANVETAAVPVSGSDRCLRLFWKGESPTLSPYVDPSEVLLELVALGHTPARMLPDRLSDGDDDVVALVPQLGTRVIRDAQALRSWLRVLPREARC